MRSDVKIRELNRLLKKRIHSAVKRSIDHSIVNDKKNISSRVLVACLKKSQKNALFHSKNIQKELGWSNAMMQNYIGNYFKRNLNASFSNPYDWVLGKDGKYVWDENVTSATDKDLNGREYIGKNFLKVKKHFLDKNTWFSRNLGNKRDGLQAFVNVNSYYNVKIPLIIQDSFNRYLWHYNLKQSGSNRLSNGNFHKTNVNNDLEILFPKQRIQIPGAVCLNGHEYNYIANINTSAINSKKLKLVDYYDEHPYANSTLARTHSGKIRGQFFAITNNTVKRFIPVISVHFDDTDVYRNVKKWYLQHNTNLKNEIEENPWKNK